MYGLSSSSSSSCWLLLEDWDELEITGGARDFDDKDEDGGLVRGDGVGVVVVVVARVVVVVVGLVGLFDTAFTGRMISSSSSKSASSGFGVVA